METQNTGDVQTTHRATSQATKAKLLAALKQAQANFQQFVESLTDDERAAIGDEAHWSAKDNIAHMAYWNGHINDLFAAVLNGTEPPFDAGRNTQSVNERIFVEWRERPWDEVVAEMRTSYAQLAANVEACPEEILTNAERTPQVADGPLANRVMGAAFWHISEHYAQFYREHGKQAQATAMQERTIPAIRDIFGPTSEELGDALYNLGCAYAKNGQSEAAIDAVRRSISLHPLLIEWSKQDSDLDSIRDLPAFQALYD